MERAGRAGKPEKILLGLTTVFLCALAVLGWRDHRAAAVPGASVETEIQVPQEALLPDLTPLDLNRATAEELMELPGIGEKLAERIVSYRREQGPFETVEELTEVSGIGEKTLAEFRDEVCVNGEELP